MTTANKDEDFDVKAAKDEDLEAMAALLAEQRTSIRLQQNAVSAELELRKAMSGMSAPAREALTLRLSGGTAAKGEAARDH